MLLKVNGVSHEVEVSPDSTLLHVLRETLKLRGAKEACGRGECGACTVLVDGTPVVSCLTLVARVRAPVTTVEGISTEFTDLREAFADCGGFQCGFCTSGQLVHAAAILRKTLPRDRREAEAVIRGQLSGNICRCTGYTGIVEAVLNTAMRRGRIDRDRIK